MSGLKKKCGCRNDKQPNLNQAYSTMVQKFKVLPTPIQSSSDKKKYKYLPDYYLNNLPITKYFRIIQLENGLIACLISDPSVSVVANEDEALSENETTDDEMTSGEETNGSSSSDDEDELTNIEQKMVIFYCIKNLY